MSVANGRAFGNWKPACVCRPCETDTDVLVLVAGQSERNRGQSARIAAYMAPIRQFLPDGERNLGLGLNDCRNPILRHAEGSAEWS